MSESFRTQGMDSKYFHKALKFQKTQHESDNKELVEKLKQLNLSLRSQTRNGLQLIVNYVSTPLIVLLKFYTLPPSRRMKPGVEIVQETLLCTLGTLTCSLKDIDDHLATQILDAILKFSDSVHEEFKSKYEGKSVGKTLSLSDETLMGILKSCRGLFKNHIAKTTIVFHKEKMFPSIGYLLYNFLEIASKEKNRTLQIQALKTIKALLIAVNNGDLIASVLPGIISSMVRIITGDYKQGTKVFCLAFNILSYSIANTLAPTPELLDQSQIRVEESLDILKNLQSPKEPFVDNSAESPSLIVKRDRKWFKKAEYYVNNALTNIFSISRIVAEETSRNVSMAPIVFESHQTRHALVEAATSILFNCFSTLKQSVPHLLEILILHTFDDYKHISEYAKTELHRFIDTRISCNNSSQTSSLFDLVSTGFFKCLTSISRIIRNPDDYRKIISLQLLSGYITILQDNINTLIITNLSTISTAIYSILSFDMSDMRILKKRFNVHYVDKNVSVSDDFTSLKNDYSFEHFRDPKISDLIGVICKLMGKYGNVEILIDHFLQDTTGDYKKEALFVLNEIVLGSRGIIDSDQPSIPLTKDLYKCYINLMKEYISPALWDNSLYNRGGQKDVAVLSSSYDSILVSTLLLEGIGNLAQVLTKRFNQKLVFVLYPMLVKLGSPSDNISTTAMNTLIRIAHYTEYEDVLSMINDNTDYIINSIYTNMRYFNNYEASLNVIHAIVRYCSKSVLPVLTDTLDELFRGLDDYNSNYHHHFIKVLHSVVYLIYSQNPLKLEDNVENSIGPSILSFIYGRKKTPDALDIFVKRIKEQLDDANDIETGKYESAKEYFQNYHETKENEVEGDESEDVDSKETHHHQGFEFVQKILEKLQHYTSSPNLETRMLVLDSIEKGLYVLAEDEKSLLPMCHTLWDALKYRFYDGDKKTLIKSLEIMKTMSILTKDFVKNKFHGDLWPILKGHLESSNPYIKNRKRKTENNVLDQYTTSTGALQLFERSTLFSLQMSILQCLLYACQSLSLPYNNVLHIRDTAWFYLSSSQPNKLQAAALELYDEITKHNPDMMLPFLIELIQQKMVHKNTKLPVLTPKKTIATEYLIPQEHIAQFYEQFSQNSHVIFQNHFKSTVTTLE